MLPTNQPNYVVGRAKSRKGLTTGKVQSPCGFEGDGECWYGGGGQTFTIKKRASHQEIVSSKQIVWIGS